MSHNGRTPVDQVATMPVAISRQFYSALEKKGMCLGGGDFWSISGYDRRSVMSSKL